MVVEHKALPGLAADYGVEAAKTWVSRRLDARRNHFIYAP